MSIDRDELIDLDVTIANFILPRLRAFRDSTESYPADLPGMAAWHAELDSMIAAFQASVDGEDDDEVTQAHLALFARRFRDLWI